MAYYNANGQIAIDEAAANADISKINSAKEKLKASQQSLKSLAASASTMKGQAVVEITSQSNRISTEIETLIGELESSIQYTRQTVNKYKEEDRQLAEIIRRGGGI